MEELSGKNTGARNTLKLQGKGNEMNKAIRILVVDDHELVRYGLRRMLEPEEDMEVVGDCANAEEAFSKLSKLRPNMVLMGAEMPGTNEIEATRGLKRNGLDYGGDVIVLGDSVDYRDKALEAGAASYLVKNVTRQELAQAIREVYQHRHSLKRRSGYVLERRSGYVDEAVELVVPPPADAACLLRFMRHLEEIFHDNFATIVRTVGSWCSPTVITTVLGPTTSPSLLVLKLANIPEVEKVEEEPVARGAFASFPKNVGVLPGLNISPSERIRVTLKETSMARRELVPV